MRHCLSDGSVGWCSAVTGGDRRVHLPVHGRAHRRVGGVARRGELVRKEAEQRGREAGQGGEKPAAVGEWAGSEGSKEWDKYYSHVGGSPEGDAHQVEGEDGSGGGQA